MRLKLSNSELWALVESGGIKAGDIYTDQENTKLIFTGKSFQVYYTEKDERYEYVGFCVGDVWMYSHNDLWELQMQKCERS